MEIRSVSFRSAGLKLSDFPKDWFPHIAVAGRSNVGKSSLLNWMFRRKLAHVAKTPGKTRTLNFFLVNDSFYVVDLPGYGYAKVAKHLQEQWGRELGNYLTQEERLAAVMTLIDIRHGPTVLDLELQEVLRFQGLSPIVVLTKADKISKSRRRNMQYTVQKELDLPYLPLVTSVTAGEGRKAVLDAVEASISSWKTRQGEKTHGT